jgi:hypothetical protein
MRGLHPTCGVLSHPGGQRQSGAPEVRSASSAKYGPMRNWTPLTSSGTRKLRSEYPWPCACVGMLTGMPATVVAKSVP